MIAVTLSLPVSVCLLPQFITSVEVELRQQLESL